MKYPEPRPMPMLMAARRIVEVANTVEPVQDGRIQVKCYRLDV